MSRFLELIEGDNQRLSMRSVCTYMVVVTLCICIFICVIGDDGSTAMGLAGILSTMMGVIYGIGKAVDGSVTKVAAKVAGSHEEVKNDKKPVFRRP